MRRIPSIILMSAFVLLLTSCGGSTPQTARTSAGAYERLAIAMREHGYSNFETTRIRTQQEYSEFLAQVQVQEHWNDKEAFVQTLESQKIDFTVKNLLLYRVSEGSGSIVLTPQSPVLENQRLHVNIDREVPDVGTADVAYYAFAYLLDKNITEVIMRVGKSSESIVMDVPLQLR